MNEIKIAERIIIDQPQNVEIAIYNLTGKSVSFEIIKKFILNERNTMFYLDRKINSSTEYGIYMDYLWIDTGFRDNRNNAIMVCLHNGYEGFVGHYTGTTRDLANYIKRHNSKNSKDIEKNYSRFLSKYKTKAGERQHEYIYNEMSYAVDIVNSKEENISAISLALQGLELELAEDFTENMSEDMPDNMDRDMGDNLADNMSEDEKPVAGMLEEFSQEENEITVGLLYEQMEKMQNYIDELLAHIESNEKESKEEIARLQEQNQEYKRALVNIRTFMEEEGAKEEGAKVEASQESNDGHSLLGRNEKILVLGNTDIRINEMSAIARDYFGFEKSDFEFITDYEKIKKAGLRVYGSERFVAVIFGNCPHKVAGMGNYASMIDEFKQRQDCPLAIDARNEAGGLKITKQSFKKAISQVYLDLKSKAA